MMTLAWFVLACTGSEAPPEPPVEEAPAEEAPAEEAPPAAPKAELPAVADIAALISQFADAKVEPVINELSGEEAGKNITRAAAGPVAGVPCSAMVSAWDDTWGCELTEAYTLDGYTNREGTYLSVNYGTGRRGGVVFSDIEPASESAVVQGVPCSFAAHFHPDGKLAWCSLSAAHTFSGIALPAKTDVSLRSDGTISALTVYEATEIGGKSYAGGMLELDASGAVTHYADDVFGE